MVSVYKSWEGLDQERIGRLFQSSFGKSLNESFFASKPHAIFLDADYRAIAVVREAPMGAYLSKLAVERDAQGAGLGRELWQALRERYPVLFWRARSDNPVVNWYLEQCEGFIRREPWLVFWFGLAPESIEEAVQFALAQPIDFG